MHLVEEKEITTRKNRGKIIELLGNSILGKMGNDFRDFSLEIQPTRAGTRKTRITRGKEHALFGSKLSLESGSVNNIYSDLLRLYKQKGNGYSEDLHMIIRMGIRLLCELAFGDQWDRKVRDEFDSAKRELSEDEKTTLSSQGVEQSNIIQLLQSGAHAYTSSGNIEQTIAISLIIGKLLEIEHGRNQ